MKDGAEDFAAARFALFHAKQKLRLKRALTRLGIENGRFDKFRQPHQNKNGNGRALSANEVQRLLKAHDFETERLLKELERKHLGGYFTH